MPSYTAWWPRVPSHELEAPRFHTEPQPGPGQSTLSPSWLHGGSPTTKLLLVLVPMRLLLLWRTMTMAMVMAYSNHKLKPLLLAHSIRANRSWNTSWVENFFFFCCTTLRPPTFLLLYFFSYFLWFNLALFLKLEICKSLCLLLFIAWISNPFRFHLLYFLTPCRFRYFLSFIWLTTSRWVYTRLPVL